MTSPNLFLVEVDFSQHDGSQELSPITKSGLMLNGNVLVEGYCRLTWIVFGNFRCFFFLYCEIIKSLEGEGVIGEISI